MQARDCGQRTEVTARALSQSGARLRRRAVLAGLGAGAASALLAACGGTATSSASATTSVATGSPSASGTSRQTSATASSAAPAVTTASAASTPRQAGAVTIDYLYQSDDLWQKDKLILDPFKTKAPQITVNPISGGSNRLEKLRTMIAGGTPPDGAWVNDVEVPGLVESSSLMAADAWLARDWQAMEGDDVYPGAWDAVAWKGKRYGTPFEANPFLPVFRPDFFDAASVPYPTAQADKSAWTWDAVVETATKLTKRGADGKATQFGIQLRTDPYSLLHWIWNNGGDMWNADRTQCLLNQPAAVEAIQYMQDFIVKSRSAPLGDEALKLSGTKTNNMLAGVIAFEWQYSGGGSLMGGVVKFPFMCAPEPKGKVSPVQPHMNGSGNAVIAGAKQAEAGWEWVKFLIGKPADQILMQTGRTPPRRKSGEAYYVQSVKYPPNPQVVADMLHTARMTPGIPAWTQFQDILNQQLKPIWLGQGAPKDALDEVVRLTNPLLQAK